MNDPTLIWFLIGAGLLLLEFTVPGLVIFFFGIGALSTAFTCWLGITESITSQLLTFSIVSLASLLTLRKYIKSWFVGNSEHETAEMKTEFINQHVKVITAIPGGYNPGKVELKGADWTATSQNAHAVGDMVKVIERDGLTLIVE